MFRFPFTIHESFFVFVLAAFSVIENKPLGPSSVLATWGGKPSKIKASKDGANPHLSSAESSVAVLGKMVLVRTNKTQTAKNIEKEELKMKTESKGAL